MLITLSITETANVIVLFLLFAIALYHIFVFFGRTSSDRSYYFYYAAGNISIAIVVLLSTELKWYIVKTTKAYNTTYALIGSLAIALFLYSIKRILDCVQNHYDKRNKVYLPFFMALIFFLILQTMVYMMPYQTFMDHIFLPMCGFGICAAYYLYAIAIVALWKSKLLTKKISILSMATIFLVILEILFQEVIVVLTPGVNNYYRVYFLTGLSSLLWSYIPSIIHNNQQRKLDQLTRQIKLQKQKEKQNSVKNIRGLGSSLEQTPGISLNNLAIKEHYPNVLLIDKDLQLIRFLQEELMEDYNVFIANNGIDGFTILQTQVLPDLIVCGLNLKSIEGLELIQVLSKSKKFNHIPIILICNHISYQEKQKAMHLGIVDIIKKPFPIEDIQSKIASILNLVKNKKRILLDSALQYITKEIQRDLKHELPTQGLFDLRCDKYAITTREKEVLQLLNKGLTNKSIANQLFISERTVSKHIQNMYTKVQVNSKSQLLQMIF